MSNRIITKNSSAAGVAPTAAQLEVGEIAVNVTDKKLYTKDAGGTVVLLNPAATGGGTGDVTGPASSVDNSVVRFDGVTGKIIQGSGVVIDDLANVTGVVNLTATGNVAAVNATLSGDLAVNGGDITSTATTVNLLNAGVTTLNVGGAATALELGATTGTTSVNNNLTVDGNTTLGDAAADTLTINGTAVTIPNNLNIDSNTLYVDATNNRSGFGTATPAARVDVEGSAAHSVVATTGAMDLALGQMFTATVAGATGWSFVNAPTGRGCTVVLHLTNGGTGIQTWPAAVDWPGGTAPTLTAAGTDVLVFVTHDGALWRGNIFGKDIK